VALKILTRAGDKSDPHFATLVNEARICGHLHHPHIVDVYGVGDELGLRFIAMEFVDGVTLADLLEQVGASGLQMPRSVILDVGIQVAQALDHAHKAKDGEGAPLGIIHRDLKPDNVMIARRGGVKVADFGIAKATTNIDSTETGMLKGTPCYIAPEIWRGGREFLPRVDLFALGAILWEMVMLRRLLGADSIPGLAGQALHGDADEEASQLVDRFPGLVPIVRRLIEREPQRRRQRASRLVGELRELRREVEAPGDLDLYFELLELARTSARERSAAMLDLDIPKTDEPGWSQVIKVVTGKQPTLPESRALELSDTVAPSGSSGAPPAPASLGTARPATWPGPAPFPSTQMVVELVPEDGGAAEDERSEEAAPTSTRSMLLAATGRGRGGRTALLVAAAAAAVVLAVVLLLLVGRADEAVVADASDTSRPLDSSDKDDRPADPDPSPASSAAAVQPLDDLPILVDQPAVERRSSPDTAGTSPPREPVVVSSGESATTGKRPELDPTSAPARSPAVSAPAASSPEESIAAGETPDAEPPQPLEAIPDPAPVEEVTVEEPPVVPPRPGCLVFQSTPAGAEVWLDGQRSTLRARTGSSARRNFEPETTVRVGMGMAGEVLAETTVVVRAGEKLTVRCELVQKMECSTRREAGGCE
jgi:serine/threonine protein kinase